MRLIDADKIIQKTYGVVIEDMFHMHETVEVVSTIDIEKAPTVKAIPIEWILNKYRGKWEKAEMGRRDFQFIEVIDELLADWEKENESN